MGESDTCRRILHAVMKGPLKKKQDLPGILVPDGQAPAMILLPPCDISHIPGSLDPVASPAEDLEVIPRPLVTTHGDGPDVVKDVGMRGRRLFLSAGFTNLLFAPGTFPSLLITDKPSHAGNRGSPFEIIFQGAGSLAAEGMLVSRAEMRSLATALGTGPTGEPLFLFRSILAIFTHYHVQISPSRSGHRSLCTSFLPVHINRKKTG